MSKDKKIGLSSLGGLVYSTNPDAISTPEIEVTSTLPLKDQKLKVILDKKQRRGKVVTLVEGFSGIEDDFQDLAKQLKTKCGTGGSAKDGIILIQGDCKKKIFEYLIEWGYSKTKMV